MRLARWTLPVFPRLLWLALVPCVVSPANAQREVYRGAYDDIRDGRLTNETADWVVAQHADDWARGWAIERTLRGGIEARGYPSPDRRFCLFVYARYGEWGQYFDATYCLVNDEGKALWADTSRVLGIPPVLSIHGTAAVYESEEKWGTAICVLRDSTGADLWRQTWNDVTQRPVQRGWREVYGFSPDGTVFVTTMNTCTYELVINDERPRTDEINETEVCIVNVETGETSRVELGWFDPRSVEFNDDSLVITGQWGVVFWLMDRMETGSVTIGFDGTVIRKTITRH